MRILVSAWLVGAALVMSGGAVLAHHSFSMYEDQPTPIEGTVLEFKYTNPHTFITVRAKDVDGHTIVWKLEGPSPASLAREGWSAKSLKPGDQIKATIYPSIKPAENSFVFEVDTDPAIFLYLDTEKTKEDFENTVAHELHHIGFGTACPLKEIAADTAKQPDKVKMVRKWVSAFGEGFAMLAAAGSPDVHPRATATQEQHERWDMDMGQFYQNRLELDNFFMKILKGELSGDKADAQAFTYFGYQGPWYTVGYRMDVVLEGAIGRQKLIQAMCDGSVLAEYNESVKGITGPRGLPPGKPMWSPEIIKALTVVKPEKTPKAEDKPE